MKVKNLFIDFFFFNSLSSGPLCQLWQSHSSQSHYVLLWKFNKGVRCHTQLSSCFLVIANLTMILPVSFLSNNELREDNARIGLNTIGYISVLKNFCY